MMKILVLCVFAVICAASQTEMDLFREFVVKHNRGYSGDEIEFASRFQVFQSNLKFIREHNAKNTGFTLGVNQFADMTNQEINAGKRKATSFGSQMNNNNNQNKNGNGNGVIKASPPSSFNWTDKGVVGPVQSMGQCGSEFIYSVVESISSSYTISQNSKKYIPLSPTEVSQCAGYGCDGVDEEAVISWIAKHGLSFDFSGTCVPKVTDGVCIQGASCLKNGDEDDLLSTLLAEGPMFISVDGSSTEFEFYESGIYSNANCSTTVLDASLLLIGYTPDSWICQNSWGTDWGMEGIIEIARNQNNMCGIASDACYATGIDHC